ncbi:MAG: UrcA family protein [Asticcacaulis sp.]
MKSTIFSASAVAAVLIAGGLTANAVQAQERVADERNVAMQDIDFSNSTKVRELYSRIQAAAAAVCRSDFNDPATANADHACEAESIRDAVAQVDQPQLSQLADRDAGATMQLASRGGDRPGTR